MLVLTSKPPTKLGRFEVGAKIGGGGMATVFLGRDIREDGSEELVALKVMKDELANDEQFLAMFEDEAKILARLSHPNVIQTLEYGIDGHSFIAMELLNGRTLADAYDALRDEDARFELADAAWICARVAEGLHSAHELVDEDGAHLGVIHRDVNPTNIFLTHGGEVKLIDFGLARARVRVSKSAEGIVKGKIPYLAPEQAQGKTIDRRVDIYALGTTLWELCAMQRLFKRDNDVDTLKAIRDAHVPDLREKDPTFPEGLWKVIDLALKLDRDERYATAEELRTDLDAFARTTGPHGPKVSSLVSRLFPGGEARQAKWLRDAATIRDGTLNPPAPVPIASSSMLEVEQRKHPSSQSHQRVDVAIVTPTPTSAGEKMQDDPVMELTPDPPSATETPPPTSRRSSVRPPSRRSIKPAPPAEETPSSPRAEPKSDPQPKSGPKSEPKSGPRSEPRSEPRSDRESDAAAVTQRRAKLKRRAQPKKAPPPEDKRRVYFMVVIGVLVLIIIALLATR